MLDRDKPFTTFAGPNPMGAKYQQGPKIFNSNDEELSWEGELIEKKQAKPAKPATFKPSRSE